MVWGNRETKRYISGEQGNRFSPGRASCMSSLPKRDAFIIFKKNLEKNHYFNNTLVFEIVHAATLTTLQEKRLEVFIKLLEHGL